MNDEIGQVTAGSKPDILVVSRFEFQKWVVLRRSASEPAFAEIGHSACGLSWPKADWLSSKFLIRAAVREAGPCAQLIA